MKMKVSGYTLREAIKEYELRSSAAATGFDRTIRAFKSEVESGAKDKPQEVVDRFLASQLAVARLQTVQSEYNLKVFLTVDGSSISLTQAVKMIGGLARAEKMWRSVASPKKDRYGYDDLDRERDPTKERAEAQITQKEAARLSSQLARKAGRLRAAIATDNATEIELDFDSTLITEVSD
jgi:hypothetical protein